MASQIVRYSVPVGATFIFHGTVLADGLRRPNPAAVYAEPGQKEDCIRDPSKANKCPRLLNCEPESTELEKLVMQGRKHLGPYRDIVMRYVNEGIDMSKCYYQKMLDNLCYMRTKGPEELRIGTVVAGSVTGLLLGIRGGAGRKIVMTTAGTAGGAYLAYPHETRKYAKKYSTIAYNFISGTPPNPKCGRKCVSPVSKRVEEKTKRCQDHCKGNDAPKFMPSWLCSGSTGAKSYPAPAGVDILGINSGGRNGPVKKNKFQCGTCGQKPVIKAPPKISAGCPMAKVGTPGLGGKCDAGKTGMSINSIIQRIKDFFGIGKK